MMLNDRIKVLIVDEYANVRQGLSALLQTAPDMVVVGEAGNGAAAVQKTRVLCPDVIIMDLIRPDHEGIAAIGAIKRESPQTRILVLTDFGEEHRVFSAFQSGAQGYLLKDAMMTNVVEAIRDIYDGKITLHPNLTDVFMRAIQEPSKR